ncbi:MAG: hypothetical protein Q9160_002302 [Pyrenula sp. 1 TL-2023]
MGDKDDSEKHLLLALPVAEAAMQQHINKLRQAHPIYRITFIQTPMIKPTVDDGIWTDVDILVTHILLPSSRALCPRLRLIHFVSAGIDNHMSHPMITSTDIPVTTSTGIHGPSMSEWFISTLLAHSLRLQELQTWHANHSWGSSLSFLTRRTLLGRRLGILGYGSIGRQTARLAQAFGMDVLAFTASPKTTPESRRLSTYTIPGTGDVDGILPSAWFSGTDKPGLHHFLSQNLDILLIAVPLSPQTRHLLGKEEFEVLAKHSPPGNGGPFVSNIARGDVVVQDDLIDALDRGVIQAAALDVADPEPLPSDSRLWDAKNCLVTPHMSGIHADYFKYVLDIVNANLGKKDGEKLVNLLERGRGY